MSTTTNTVAPDQVDVRGPRFAAWVTTVVIVATLVVSGFSYVGAAAILGLQAVIFEIGAWRVPFKLVHGHTFLKRGQRRVRNAR